MTPPVKFPFYVKASLFSIGTFAFISMLYVGQDIILPLLYAAIIAISLSPLVNYLVKKKLNRALSITIVLLVATLAVATLITLLSLQASRLSDAWPQLSTKFQDLLTQTVNWASGCFGISADKINEWIAERRTELMNNSTAFLGITLTTVGGVLASAFLTPVYIFMILYYQPHLLEFIHKLFVTSNDRVSEILTETKTIIQSYLSGLFIEFGIVAVLNSIGLLLLGIDYAILLGIISAMLNVIPYLGGIIGVVMFMIIALVTKPPVYVLYVVILYSVIQFVDNNYIVPKIVGSKVKLNAFVSVVAVILGAALWGIPGMFLSIPITAVLKLIFDRIDSLKPWGFLLGDTPTTAGKMKFKFTIKGFLGNFISKK
jgi:predicted PurR-regulated permease PerM